MKNDPLWRLQWEVDQEADELLGGLLPTMAYNNKPNEDSMEEMMDDKEELNFSMFFEGNDSGHPPVEDLDHLEPGWNLNEGFEWGPATDDVSINCYKSFS